MKELFQHTAITDGIVVRVAVNFLPEQSRIEAGKWFWVYHIRIENDSDQPVQLMTRHWRITDGTGPSPDLVANRPKHEVVASKLHVAIDRVKDLQIIPQDKT